MKLEHKVLGKVGTNCYCLMNEKTEEIIIVDPADWPEDIEKMVENLGGRPVAVLLTHAHFDHIRANDAIREKYQIKAYINELERDTLTDPELNQSWMGKGEETYSADVFLKDGETVELAGYQVQMISTPGHTPGGACFYIPEEKLLFSGDTLFNFSVGRTDFKGSSHEALITNIKEKLLTLPEDVKVLPGHMSATTIEREKKRNPFLV